MDDRVNCPNCAGPASVWAARCPACGADLAALETGPTPQPAASVPGPRRGRAPLRRTPLVPVVAVVVALAGLALTAVVSSGPGRSGQWPSMTRGLAIAQLQEGRLVRYANGQTGGVALGAPQARVTFGPIEVSGEAVAVVGGLARSYGPDGSVVLGPAQYGVVNIDDTGVWLVDESAGHPATVGLVSVTGQAEVAASRLPSGAVVLADAGPGLLLAQGAGPPFVWEPTQNRVYYRFPASFAALVATGDPFSPHAAWRDDHCGSDGACGLHLTDLVTRVDQLISPPPGCQGYLPGGAFSPDDTPVALDDTLLAVVVLDPHHRHAMRIDLIPTLHPASGRLSGDLRSPSGASGQVVIHWSPAGFPQVAVVDDGGHQLVVDAPDEGLRSIPVVPSPPFAVL